MSEYKSSNVPDFKPTIPADLIPDLDNKDRYLFERIDVLTQSMNWQNDKMSHLEHSVDKYREDIDALKQFKSQLEQSSSLESAVSSVKKENSGKVKRFMVPAAALFLGVLYPIYLEGYREVGSSTIVKNILNLFK